MNIQVEMDERDWMQIVSIIAQATNPFVAKITQAIQQAHKDSSELKGPMSEAEFDRERRSGNSHGADRR